MPARMRGSGVHSGRGEVSAAVGAAVGEDDSGKEENDGKQEEKALRHRCRLAAAGAGSRRGNVCMADGHAVAGERVYGG